ncbi:MAG: hypothetical protein ACLP6G_13500 [Terriglobales bacterium]
MRSLLNRICRGIEDAWTAGFIQLFIVAILGYTVVNNVVQHLDNVRMETRLENKYNQENGTDIHLNGVGPPTFDLAESLWRNAPQLIVIAFVIAYEVSRRRRFRSRPAAQGDQAPDALSQGPGGSLRGVMLELLRVALFLVAVWIAGWLLSLLGRLLVRINAWMIAWRYPEVADFVSHHPNSATAHYIQNTPFDVAAVVVCVIVFLVLSAWAEVSLQKQRAKKAGGGSSAKQPKPVR